MKIVVKEGVNENSHWTKVAREIADYTVNELHLSFGNVEFRLVSNDGLAAASALYASPFPTWYTGQNYVLRRERMGARYESLYEMVGHVYKNISDNEEYTVVYINKADEDFQIKSVMAHVYGHMHMDYNNYICKGERVDLAREAAFRERYLELEKILNEGGAVDGKAELQNHFDTSQTLEMLIDLYPESRTEADNSFKNYYKTTDALPEERVYDVYKFLLENASMNPWEKEFYSMTYEAARLYRTAIVKIMHEGFATFVQKKYALYGEKDPVTSTKMQLFIDNVATPSNMAQLPYAFGLKLFERIEERGNKGQFGFGYDLLSTDSKRAYNDKSGKGLEKVLDSLRFSDDLGFLNSYADDLFLADYVELLKRSIPEDFEPQTEKDAEFKDWVDNLTTEGLKFMLQVRLERSIPRIELPKNGTGFIGGFGRGLLLEHDTSFIDRCMNSYTVSDGDKIMLSKLMTLDNHSTGESLNRLSRMWKHPVYIKTIDADGDPCVIGSNGTSFKTMPVNQKSKGLVRW